MSRKLVTVDVSMTLTTTRTATAAELGRIALDAATNALTATRGIRGPVEGWAEVSDSPEGDHERDILAHHREHRTGG